MLRDVSASRRIPAPGRGQASRARLLPCASHSSPAVALFARAAVPGHAKTRLIPMLGAADAARLQSALISDGVAKLNRLRNSARVYLYLDGSGAASRSDRNRASRLEIRVVKQRGRDLGARLLRAFQELLGRHRAAVVIGADSPELDLRPVRLALSELESSDAVLGPCPDGGYYLIGLRRGAAGGQPPPGLFRNVRWGSRYAFRDTLDNLLASGRVVSVLDPCSDVDRPRDFRRLRRRFESHPALRRLSPAVWRFMEAWTREGRARR